jgi:hypothetical protein
MINRVVYGYTLINNYWKGQSDLFFKLARLSVKLAKMHYKDVVFYTDRKTERKFKEYDIEFDEVIYLPEMKNVNEHSYGLAKIYTMMAQTEPYIILDFDTLLFENIQTQNTITYGYKEGEPEIIAGKEYINKYYLESYKTMQSKIDIALDWLTFPNNSFVAVKNPLLVKNIYKKILQIMKDDLDKQTTTVQFYEQCLLYNYLAHYKTDIGFLYERAPFSEHSSEYDIDLAVSKKMIHMDFYFRQPHSEKLIDNINEQILNFKQTIQQNEN